MPVLHSLQQSVGNHTIANAIRDGLAAPAHPLDFALRTGMERRLGHDFSNVRIHVDAGAAARVEARAFAFGDDIVLASHNDRDTLPHELTHVAQQRGRALTIPTRLAQSHEPAERHAEAAPAPEALHRTPARQVSCAPGPLVLPNGTSVVDPVAVITAAENLANQWLDLAIADLDGTIAAIRGGEEIASPAIGDGLASAMRDLRLDPDRRATWFGNGGGTAALLVRRLRMIRRTIGAGTFYFTCLGRAHGRIGDCTGPICDTPTSWAASCAGSFRTHLCPLFWRSSLEERAATIVHETSHNFAAFIQDSGHQGNAHCWERFVVVVGGGPESIVPHSADTCPEPAP